MKWETISAQEAVLRLKRGARALDVRSPKEFEKGALPEFVNTPILNDEHRHLVGLEYKTSGQERAIELGMKLVAPLRDGLVSDWRRALENCAEEQRLLICWRGGLRSSIAADWMSEGGIAGLRVRGGYKSMRALLLASLRTPPPFVLLSGMTGSGKTEVLRELPVDRYVDIEAIANHRGSAFGGYLSSPQPTQQTFENKLGFALFERTEPFVFEDESFLIGKCAVPEPLRTYMALAPVVVLEDKMENRVRRVFGEYVSSAAARSGRDKVRDGLLRSLERISPKLGGLRYAEMAAQIRAAFAATEDSLENHAGWIESLLGGYYDPRYVHGFEAKKREVLFRGDAGAVKDFLADRFGWRRA